MANEKISVDDLLTGQAKPMFTATVETIEGEPDKVKITPWTAAAGCLCHLSINIIKASLIGVTPTGETHVCCGKTLKVVELHFKKDESIRLEDVFGQLSVSASGGASSHGSGHVDRLLAGGPPPPVPPVWGWDPPWLQQLLERELRRRYAQPAEEHAEMRFLLPPSCETKYLGCLRNCGRNVNCTAGCIEQYELCQRILRPWPV